jgi:hypothetical protein
MHLNACTIVGRVSKAGPKLSYAEASAAVAPPIESAN